MSSAVFEKMSPFIIMVLIFAIILIVNIVKNINKAKKKKPKRVAPAGPEGLDHTFSASGDEKAIRAYRRLEDRENDWLARQLREEKASEKRFSAMFGLKLEHAMRCDADGVDNGEGK